MPADDVVETLVMQREGDLVDVLRVDGGDDRIGRDVAEQGDLALQVLRDRVLAAADDHVGLDSAPAQLGHRVLRRLGLLLTRGARMGHERQVEIADVVASDVTAELADRLQERHDLDVADGAADLDDDDVDAVAAEAADPLFDLVGDVRNDLHGLSEIVAPPLLGDHRRVDLSRRRVRVLVEVLVDEPLVVPEVEIRLAAVLGDEHLAVLEGVHRAGVDVDVRVELAHRDPETTRLEEPAERGGGETLSERAHHTTRHEHELRHALLPSGVTPGYRSARNS